MTEIEIEIAGRTITVRPFARADAVEVARFAAHLPPHDLLFLSRDIQNPRVVAAWLDAADNGEIASLIAMDDDRAVATTAIVRDKLGWSAHVAELRLLVDPAWRGKGLGRALLEHSVAIAIAGGATKLAARMTPDRTSAITLFEEHGFRAEALLRDHVVDRDGNSHDLAILALDVARRSAQQAAYGEAA